MLDLSKASSKEIDKGTRLQLVTLRNEQVLNYGISYIYTRTTYQNHKNSNNKIIKTSMEAE